MRLHHGPKEWLVVAANFQDKSSIGHVARALTRGLYEWLGTQMRAWCTSGQRAIGVPDGINKPGLDSDVCLFVGFPLQARKLLERYPRVVGAYVCESERIRPEWVEACNRHTAIIVPSEFCQKAFVDSGVTVPVYVVPHGVDAYYWGRRAVAKPAKAHNRFGVVAALNHYHARKAPDVMVEAWERWVKTHPDDRLEWRTGDYPPWTDRAMPKGWQWVLGRVTDMEMAKWYRQLDALIMSSRSEGFGLPGLEAMAVGTPIIAPAHSGILQYADAKRDCLFPPGPPETILTYDHESAAVPGMNAKALLEAMERFAKNKAAYTEQASTLALQQWSWHSICGGLAEILAAVRLRKSTQRLTGPISTAPVASKFNQDVAIVLGERERKVYEADASGLGQVIRGLVAHLPVANPGEARAAVIPVNPNECKNYKALAKGGAAIPYVAWESDVWPAEWVRRFNAEASLVLVPQPWAAECLIRSGCKVPVHAVPQAFQRFQVKRTKRKGKDLVLGFMGVPVQRKNLLALIEAMPKGTRLIARCPWLPDGFKKPQNPKVEWLVGPLTDDELKTKFWSAVDLVVCPFAGEGYSMVPREAVALGIPTIVSDIPAHADIVCPRIAVAGKIPAYFEWAKKAIGEWYEVTPEAIRQAIQRSIEAKFAWMQSVPGHEWSETAAKVRAIAEPTVGTYVSWRDVGGGIERFALRMAEVMPRLEFFRDMNQAERGAARLKAMFWQLEYGLVDKAELAMLRQFKKNNPGCKLFVIVHSACPGLPELPTNRVIQSVADKIILLTQAQTQVFPTGLYRQHPWPEPGEYQAGPSQLVFGTHGFIHQQKNYPELFRLARQHKARVKVCGLAQPTNSTSLRIARTEVTPNLRPDDYWRNELVSDTDLQAEMSKCTLLVYPYKDVRNFQASGAVREAIRWGVPIVCSDRPYFDDLPKAAFPRLDQVAWAIDHRRELQAAQAEYARAYSWAWFGEQLMRLCE